MTSAAYPHRKYGYDHARYSWSYSKTWEKAALKGGARAGAFIVMPLEYFPLNPSGIPFRHPGAMVTPYPDLRHYTTRDYGLRVGVYRILRELSRYGLKAVVPVNAVLLDRCQPLIRQIVAEGHEIAAHGLSTDHIHHAGLSRDEEDRYVSETRTMFGKHGLDPRVWMSPARNQSFHSPDIIRRHGFTTCLDWEMDQRPVAMETASGPVTCLPLHHELNDFNILITKHQSEEEWADQIISSADLLVSEYMAQGAQLFGFTLTPYVSGLPFRIRLMREVLSGLANTPGLMVGTASHLLDAWEG